MDKIDKVFYFLSVFEKKISEMLDEMPDEHRNTKVPTMGEFEGDNTFWDEYTKSGHDTTTL